MTPIPLIFAAGILGSSHCVGMCGPFAAGIGSGALSWRTNVVRQVAYTLGRVVTYAFFGAVAGAGGRYLQQHLSVLVNAAALLAIAAGVFLVYQGLLATRLIRRKTPSSSGMSCLVGEFYGAFLNSPRLDTIFLAGLFTSMLPCGLVYGMVALAASSGDLVRGASLMVVFGLGTAPMMMLTGCGGSLLSPAVRKSVFRVAGWCVVLAGLLSIARGAGFLDVQVWSSGAGCLLCR